MTHLFTPGPVTVPEPVMRAMSLPAGDHRAPDFPNLVAPLIVDLKTLFGNEYGRVFLYPSSGTGAWEAAITNTLSQGDRVLMARHGHFSHLWARLAARLGLDVECVDAEWGTGVPVDAFRRYLAHDPGIRAVFVTHNETSTGVVSDVAAVREAMDELGSTALLFVDAVSSLGAMRFDQDRWGVDVAVAASQKGLMLPAGLGLVSVSERALAASHTVQGPRGYFAFSDQIPANNTGYFPYTPPVPLLYGLRASLDMLFAEGLGAVFARHHRLAGGVRAAIAALGLPLCAADPCLRSNAVSAIRVPPAVDATEVLRIAYQRYHTSFGGGLGPLQGTVFRIGHLGAHDEVTCLSGIAAAELALADAGAEIALGAGVAAALSHYQQARRPAHTLATA